MVERPDERYGTYRCPVCGHRDGMTLPRSESTGLVSCSYCETPLEVTARGTGSVRFSAQVAREPATS